MANRAPGFYWYRIHGEPWSVAEWVSYEDGGHWYFLGDESEVTHDPDEVGPRLEPPR